MQRMHENLTLHPYTNDTRQVRIAGVGGKNVPCEHLLSSAGAQRSPGLEAAGLHRASRQAEIPC